VGKLDAGNGHEKTLPVSRYFVFVSDAEEHGTEEPSGENTRSPSSQEVWRSQMSVVFLIPPFRCKCAHLVYPQIERAKQPWKGDASTILGAAMVQASRGECYSRRNRPGASDRRPHTGLKDESKTDAINSIQLVPLRVFL